MLCFYFPWPLLAVCTAVNMNNNIVMCVVEDNALNARHTYFHTYSYTHAKNQSANEDAWP